MKSIGQFSSSVLGGGKGTASPAPVRAVDFFEREALFLASVSTPSDTDVLAAFRAHRRSIPRTPLYQFVCMSNSPRDPYALMEKGFAIFGYDAFPARPPIDWGANPFNDRSWRYHLNNLELLDPVILVYDETGDAKLLAYAIDVVRDWLQQNLTATEEQNPFAWYDMAVGLRATKLAWVIEAAACAADVDDDVLIHLLAGAIRHGQELRDPAKLAKATNHGLFQMLGLLALTKTLPEVRGFAELEAYGTTQVERMLTEHYCEQEGIHLEHSPTYHRYLTDLLNTALLTGLVDSPRLSTLRDKAYAVMAWMIKPDGTLTRLGDCDYEPRVVPQDVLAPELRSRYPGLWFVLTRGAEGSAPPHGALIAPVSGHAFIRGTWPTQQAEWEGSSYFSFSAAFHSRTHKHADEGTFEWSARGQSLIVDSGSFGYHYTLPERQYCESTRAHNTVEIDGADYSRNRVDAFGSAIRRWAEANGVYAIEAEFSRKPGIDHRRTLLHVPQRWVVVIDDINAAHPHTFTQWFHFAPPLELVQEDIRATLALPGGDQTLIVQPLTTPDGLALRTVRGQTEPRFEGWTSLAYKELTPNWAAAYTACGTKVLFATLLALGPTDLRVVDSAVTPAPGNSGLEVAWSCGDESMRIVLRRRGDDLQLTAHPAIDGE